MTMDERIARINELYHKSQAEGLTDSEKEEQARLRREYIDSVKGSLKSQLDNVDIKEKDGSITNLGEMVKKKSDVSDAVLNKKAELRNKYRKLRDSLSPEEIKGKSELVLMRLFNDNVYKKANLILLYASIDSEVQTDDILKKAFEDGKRVAYPKCVVDGNESYMDFYEISDFSQLKSGYKGIMEPDIDNFELKKIEEKADLCVVPGVAFTRKGQRIGYGKGFYDKFMQKDIVECYVGITYKQQLTHKFEAEATDMCVDMVITEENIYVCN